MTAEVDTKTHKPSRIMAACDTYFDKVRAGEKCTFVQYLGLVLTYLSFALLAGTDELDSPPKWIFTIFVVIATGVTLCIASAAYQGDQERAAKKTAELEAQVRQLQELMAGRIEHELTTPPYAKW